MCLRLQRIVVIGLSGLKVEWNPVDRLKTVRLIT
jgi:hypothetical protein